MLTLTI
jgi:hypothetical protein